MFALAAAAGQTAAVIQTQCHKRHSDHPTTATDEYQPANKKLNAQAVPDDSKAVEMVSRYQGCHQSTGNHHMWHLYMDASHCMSSTQSAQQLLVASLPQIKVTAAGQAAGSAQCWLI